MRLFWREISHKFDRYGRFWPTPAKIHKYRYPGRREQAAGSCNHDKDTPASTIRRAVSASAVRPSGNFFRSGFQLGKIAEMRQRVGLRVP
jgi:hypothetical protein